STLSAILAQMIPAQMAANTSELSKLDHKENAKDKDYAREKTVTHAQRAGLLAKNDLVSAMVGEFPELQGIMGGYYAKYHSEPEDIAVAIREHYQPRFAGDAVPDTLLGCLVAIADKIDTLTGLFGVGQPPSGEKDPFGLRRSALGVLRIIIEKKLPLD